MIKKLTSPRSLGLDGDAASNRLAIGETRHRLIGMALAAAAVLCFSLRPILVKLAYVEIPDAVTLLALRMGLSLPFFLAIALWTGGQAHGPRLAPRDLALVGLLGFLGYYLASLFDFIGIQYVSAGVGRLLLFTYPTIVVVLSAIFLRKPITTRALVALALTYGGLALVLSGAWGRPTDDLVHGAAFVFVGAFFYAIYLVAGSEITRRLGAIRFTAVAMSVACSCVVIHFLATRPTGLLFDLSFRVWSLAAAIAVICTLLPTFMTAEALRRIGANQVAMIGALGPVSTILLGYLGLDEILAPLQVVGALFVLGGVLLVTLRAER